MSVEKAETNSLYFSHKENPYQTDIFHVSDDKITDNSKLKTYK